MKKSDKKYNNRQDYCSEAEKSQSVPSYSETYQNISDNGDYPSNKAIRAKREGTWYSCNDDYTMGSIQDNKIYIATTDAQHEKFAGKEPGEIQENVGLSGYFSDQATVDACKDGGTLDNTKYNQMTQIAPYREGGPNGAGDAQYKPHVDCFEIDRDKLKENYHTTDFNAAIGKCQANSQFGEGGGNQGYNPHIDEMIANGTLKHKPEESYSDPTISELDNKKQNHNRLDNSVVPEDDYVNMMDNAETRSRDCVKNNTPHPSDEARQNGFPPNEHPVEGNTGNAVPVNQKYQDHKPNSDQNDSKIQENPKKQEDTKKQEDPKKQDESAMPTTSANTNNAKNQDNTTVPTTSANANTSNNQNTSRGQDSDGMPTTSGSSANNSNTASKETPKTQDNSEMPTTSHNTANTTNNQTASKGQESSGMPTTSASPQNSNTQDNSTMPATANGTTPSSSGKSDSGNSGSGKSDDSHISR